LEAIIPHRGLEKEGREIEGEVPLRDLGLPGILEKPLKWNLPTHLGIWPKGDFSNPVAARPSDGKMSS